MNNLEKAIIKEKKFEFWLGMFFLIPPILGVIAFIPRLFDIDIDFFTLSNLTNNWTSRDGMSAAPIYLGMMAIVGVYLIKDRLRYIISEKENNSESK